MLAEEYPQRIDIAYEGVGGPLRDAVVDNLAPGGRLLAVGYISAYPHTQTAESHSAPCTITLCKLMPCPAAMHTEGLLAGKAPLMRHRPAFVTESQLLSGLLMTWQMLHSASHKTTNSLTATDGHLLPQSELRLIKDKS